MSEQQIDLLDRAVLYLKTRDGTDKLLKILRYGVKLLLAAQLVPATSEATKRLKSFESSVGVSRKALRLGKFLQDVDELRKAPSLLTTEGILELIASGGEGVYYFVEQFIWLVKAGAIDKRHGPHLTKMSALFELIGYAGSITLKAMQLAALLQKEAKLRDTMKSRSVSQVRQLPNIDKPASGAAMGGTGGTLDESSASVGSTGQEIAEKKGLRVLRFKRLLKTLSLIQDIGDSFLAFADVIDEDKQPLFLRSPAFLAAAGLLSAAISMHKNWVSVG